MASLITALVTMTSACCGTVVGSIMRHRLPEHHLRDESKDVVKTASGMIATLVALVIGLLVSSSKGTYDQASTNVTQIGAKVILLNRALERYGPETKPIRDRLREGMEKSVDQLWPTHGGNPNLSAIEKGTGMDEVHDLIVRLDPQDEIHRILKTYALSTWGDLVQARWLIIEQAQNTLPTTFLAMLIFWLTMLFVSLGLLAPRNATTWACLFICAMSMAGALYLILEMDRPIEGTMQISPAPLLKAISIIGRTTGP